jgi:hypothetical protein
MESPTSREKREKWGTLVGFFSARPFAQRKKWAPGIFYEIKKGGAGASPDRSCFKSN